MDTCTANSTQRKDRIPHMADIQFNHGTLFEGTTGWVAVTRAGWKVYPESLYKKAKNPGQIRLKESKHHARHFVDCVLSRKQPISNLHSAVRSDMICHLSDICIRTGREIEWDPKKETIVNDPDAQQRMHRDMRLPWTL